MKNISFACVFAICAAGLITGQHNIIAHAAGASSGARNQSSAMEFERRAMNAQKPAVSFKAVETYSAGAGNTSGMAVGDLDGDGNPDIVLASECQDPVPDGACSYTSGQVSVLLGKGDGMFQLNAVYNSGGDSAVAVSIGDVNGDGVPDIIAISLCVSGSNCESGNGTVGVLLGNGDGTFQPVVTYSSGGYLARSVAIGDVNGDGYPDLVVANECQSGPGTCNGEVSVLLGNGNGTFQAAVPYSSGGAPTESVAIGDLTGDGIQDVVAINQNGIGVLIGNGDGTFQAPVIYSSGGYDSVSIAIGDVDGDGVPDLVVANYCLTLSDCQNQGDGAVAVLLGNGNGTFQSPVSYDSGGWAEWAEFSEGISVTIGDVNGDGIPDLVVANSCASGEEPRTCKAGIVGVLLGNGDGTFQAAVPFSSGASHGQAVVVADVNADGRPDVLVANFCNIWRCSGVDWTGGTVGVLLNAFIAKTSTEVSSSLNPSQINQSVTFTATLTSNSSVPNGSTVTFYSGVKEIGTGITSNGIASLTTSFSTAGKYTIKATYAGDAFHKASSGTVKQQVLKQ
jgi:hypothetical protein